VSLDVITMPNGLRYVYLVQVSTRDSFEVLYDLVHARIVKSASSEIKSSGTYR